MGTCKYCGQSAGLFSKVHKACEDKHQQGMAELLAAMHSYFKGKDSIQTVLSKIAVGQQDCYLQTSDIEDCASKTLDLFCEQIKFPVTKQYLAIIETFLNNVKVSRMGLNKDGSLDRLAMKLHQGVLVSHFAESIDSRPLKTLYVIDLQFIIMQIICLYLQDFVSLQYKSCRYLC